MRQLFLRANTSDGRIRFIFVSQWMRQISERDVGVKLRSHEVIPNFIDTHLFKYRAKRAEDRHRVLLIRSFNSAKYANDWAVEAIHALARRYPAFEKMRFTIVGEGLLWQRLTSTLRYPNVTLVNRMLDHQEMKALHDQHGIFLCPTRQDAQGVSMCEAMASGLVPVTSNNTAIPEYVSNDEGYLCDSPDQMAAAMQELDEQADVFTRKSLAAARRAERQTGLESTIKKEIDLITQQLGWQGQ
jgi:glycosyltransferase involved in cell wall biosynthesis